MTAFIDLSGRRVGRLLILKRGDDKILPSGRGSPRWQCICDCGKTTLVHGVSLRAEKTQSCGCYIGEAASIRNARHGDARSKNPTPEYRLWAAMISRCHSSNNKDYSRYGGRGIKVCDEWREDFSTFLVYVGRRPSSSRSLDRYPNNDGNYEPGNVRWATTQQQGANKRNTLYVELNGESVRLVDAARTNHIPYNHAWRRHIKYGWPIEQALGLSARQRNPS